ncbi:MCR_0457 family protein [Acinetobacter shaoyimingii]|uniref:DUF7944 domain-containing protein n=1 Tax=Acinetobacter shaoyimingii TaxID=2715164 RepID=A0A6G8RWX4_9GAMM|nr:hypothetical protein [Acinetobacter shaoyimingii]NHB57754.1 hypothetical protein [Acinetobacter shaoyimingii]QIO06361.1 hypothetical protein G8E00_10565 [Acinetobacter shaoyimingii]
MNNQLSKTLAFLTLTSSMMLSTWGFAKDNTEKDKAENIDVTQQQVTKEELAAIYVLSEICPKLIKVDDEFKTGYTHLLKDYLPNEKSPQTTLNSLAKQKDFKAALKQARDDAKHATEKENQQICEDVKKYQS